MVKRLEEVTSGGGLYIYYIYQNVFGKLDFECAGFNSKWRNVPPGPDQEIIERIEKRGSIETRNYISKTKKLPLIIRFSYIEGIDQIIMKIDNLDYEFLK